MLTIYYHPKPTGCQSCGKLVQYTTDTVLCADCSKSTEVHLEITELIHSYKDHVYAQLGKGIIVITITPDPFHPKKNRRTLKELRK